MATSAELLKAIKGGAEVRIVFSSGDHGHTALEYLPRYKGDRQPWVKHVGSEAERYSAGQCVAVHPKPAVEQADTKETDDMADETRTFTGPLTPVQTQALKYLSQGMRHGEIGGHYTPTRSKEHVSQVLTAARRKMGAQTATEAACMVATAEAYLSAAEMIETDRPLHPESDETDEHVWHVMTGLAKTLRERAAALLPK